VPQPTTLPYARCYRVSFTLFYERLCVNTAHGYYKEYYNCFEISGVRVTERVNGMEEMNANRFKSIKPCWKVKIVSMSE
jgi:hypothetical protein